MFRSLLNICYMHTTSLLRPKQSHAEQGKGRKRNDSHTSLISR